MGSNRRMMSSASQPLTTMQTHTPCGSNSRPAPTLTNSQEIKREPVSDLDLGLSVDCQTESWAESYQDLSSWCNATSACSPATCQSPVTDETFIIGSDFQGLSDFDLRKSEEIASMPVDEVGSFNLWGSERQQSSESSVFPSVGAASSTVKNESVAVSAGASSAVKPEPVLLHDCWLFEGDRGEGLKGATVLKQSPTVTSSITTSTNQQFTGERPLTHTVVKDKSTSVVAAPQQLLTDPVKMAELQRRLERIASHTHPGTNSKEKAAELLKMLQRQITMFNKKKYNSPAAVADLPNNTGYVPQTEAVCYSGTSTEPCYVCPAVTSAPSASSSSENLFQSDPFDGLFNLPEVQGGQQNYSHNLPSLSSADQNTYSQSVVTSAVPFASNTYPQASSTITSQSGTTGRPLGKNVFNEAHQEVLKSATKVEPQHATDQVYRSQPLQQAQMLMVQMPQQQSHHQQIQLQTVQHQVPPQQHSLQSKASPAQRSITLAIKKDPQSSVNRSGRLGMPELELNFDALLFEPTAFVPGFGRVPDISTPEVLKPLVDVPDPEGFDLLSYVCDDKACTPPVVLENNPFHFPQADTNQVSGTQLTFPDRKSNVMVVKPLSSESRYSSSSKLDPKDNAVIVQIQPELMPSTIMEEDEEVKEVQPVKVQPVTEFVESKKESSTTRPVRSPRKRKLSDDFIVEASEIEEVTRAGRRRRVPSSRIDSDDEYVLPVRRARKKTSVIIEEDDDDEEVVVRKRPKTSVLSSSRAARGERTVSTSSESDRYRELRDRNNEASRKSRLTRKAREQELGRQAEVLTKENRILKVKVDEMENLVRKLREALLQSMMKKS